jgi:DHA1 family tetracycline resistance protein-like MFS transporter
MSSVDPPAALAEPRRAAVLFIFVTVLLDILALGLIIPVLPLLIEDFRGGDTAYAARTIGVFGAVWAGVQFFAAPVLGSLSDRFGRRPVILLSNFGLALDYVLMAVAPSLTWLFLGRVLSGITSASIPTAYAYVADVTAADRRARAYGLLGAAFGVGFIVGPAVGGLLGQWGPRTPFWVAAGLSFANAMYGLFVLPESLPATRRAAFSWRRANPLGSLAFLRAERNVRGFAVLHFLYQLAHQSLQSVFVLYTGYRYGWQSVQVGWSLAAMGVCSVTVQGGLVGPIVSRLGERRTLLAGLVAGTIGFTIYALAPTSRLFIVGIPLMALWGLYGPTSQGLVTRHVAPTQQGTLQGALASVAMTTGLVGPVLFTQVFSAFIDPERAAHLPGAPYLLAALLLVVAVAVAVRVARPPVETPAPSGA